MATVARKLLTAGGHVGDLQLVRTKPESIFNFKHHHMVLVLFVVSLDGWISSLRTNVHDVIELSRR